MGGREDMDEQEVGRVVRGAAESVYGVIAVTGPGWFKRAAARLKLGSRGVVVHSGPPLQVAIDLSVAPGVPTGEVAANVAEKVRYVVRRDLGQVIDDLIVRVDGRPVSTIHPPGANQSAASR